MSNISNYLRTPDSRLLTAHSGGMVLMASMSVSKTEGPGSRPGAPAIITGGDVLEQQLNVRSESTK